MQTVIKTRELVRSPNKLAPGAANLDVVSGSITDFTNIDGLVGGVDFVVSMLGDKNLQKHAKINMAFIKRLVLSMGRPDVKRFLY